MFILLSGRINQGRIKIKIISLAVIFLSLTLIHTRTARVSSVDLPRPLVQVKTAEKVMALTVNVDWGEEYIPAMLEIFGRYDVKATFFVTGRWAAKNPEMLKNIAAGGHLLGNHGYSHPHPDRLSLDGNREEIRKTEKVIEELTGTKTTYFAPPYGEQGRNCLLAADELGYRTVLWTLDTVDWRQESTSGIITARILNPKALNGVQPQKEGAVVLMHPKANTVQALPGILSALQKEGFRFVTVERLITFAGKGNTTP